jgi:hypothetical protein
MLGQTCSGPVVGSTSPAVGTNDRTAAEVDGPWPAAPTWVVLDDGIGPPEATPVNVVELAGTVVEVVDDEVVELDSSPTAVVVVVASVVVGASVVVVGASVVVVVSSVVVVTHGFDVPANDRSPSDVVPSKTTDQVWLTDEVHGKVSE